MGTFHNCKTLWFTSLVATDNFEGTTTHNSLIFFEILQFYSKKMDLGEVYQKIGEFGPYQLLICTFLVMTSFSTTFASLGIVFTMAVSEHYCYIPELRGLNSSIEDIKNATIPYDEEAEELSECDMYDRDYSTWTEDDVMYYAINGNVDNASTVTCRDGWTQDLSVYGDTVTTDVM